MGAMRKTMLIFLACIVVLLVSGCLYLRQEKFGRLPEGDRLVTLQQSPNYWGGRFHNQVEIKEIVKGGSSFFTFIKFFSTQKTTPNRPAPRPW